MGVNCALKMAEATCPRRAAHKAALHPFAGGQVFHMDGESALLKKLFESVHVRHIEGGGMREEMDRELEAIHTRYLHPVMDHGVSQHGEQHRGIDIEEDR